MLDTDTCICLRRRPASFRPRLPVGDCGISVIVLGELEWGVSRSRRVEENEAALRGLREGVVTRHILDETLPGGRFERAIEYRAPLDRCDREEHYRTAWAAFSLRFGRPDGARGSIVTRAADGTRAEDASSVL
ncbi:MAG: hypothetical protein OXF27_12720 [Acidobacteria bacterium]|nr:hypothetical protein [Acidobacteriota bacterium]